MQAPVGSCRRVLLLIGRDDLGAVLGEVVGEDLGVDCAGWCAALCVVCVFIVECLPDKDVHRVFTDISRLLWLLMELVVRFYDVSVADFVARIELCL